MTERCPECGAQIPGEFEGCQSLLHEAAFLATSDLRFAKVHRLFVDTFCMQHVEPYGHSAKSYAAHLMCLCCGIEHEGDPKLYAAIQRWLNGKVEIPKPEVLSRRGEMTIMDVLAPTPVQEKIQRVHVWATAVWAAYTSQHDLAHEWISQAQGHPTKH